MSTAGLRALQDIAERRTAETTWRLHELSWLIDGGVWPVTACTRVGWTVDAALRAARRHDPSLVTVLSPYARRAA